MIKRIKSYKIPLLLTIFLFLFHLANKDFDNPYERPIAGDAQAYYAYLPALFIYHDLSYDFVDDINEKYYPKSLQKSFLKPVGDGRVNKTFPGLAVLYLPFFLIAHGIALLFGLNADGYSTVYQLLFDIGLWFYLWIGLVFFIKVLRFSGFSAKIANWSSAIVLLGTNMVFYSVYDQSVSHIYNFFMINALLYFLLKYRDAFLFKDLAKVLFLFALIGITRPTNILVVGLVLFFIPDLSFYKTLFSNILKPKNFLRLFFIGAAVLAIPFILWKLQTNNWVVYSYGDEGFNFSDPHLSDFLFSYIKGWFTYTPIAFIILIVGFILLYKQNKRQFTIGLLFYASSVYIFSSWWCWYYGAGMGQRVMIDHYILLGFLLALILQKLNQPTTNRIKQIAFGSLVVFAVGLNIAQAYQIRYGILTGGSATQNQYWNNFLSFEKKAEVYPQNHWILEETHNCTLAPTDKAILKGNSYYFENDWAIQVTDYDKYSPTIAANVTNIRKGSKIIISFLARAIDPITETRLVVDIDGQNYVFSLSPYLKQNQWVKIEYMVEPTKPVLNKPLIYFWNGGSNEKVEFKQVIFKHYFYDGYF